MFDERNQNMKTVAMNLQHENWEDDGGAHDVFVVQLEDDEFEELKNIEILDSESELYEKLHSRQVFTFPLTIDAVMTVWYKY
jgi:hypothetical protein